MEGVDEPPNQKKNIILMMCLCVALGLVGQFSQHWLVGDDVEYPSHSSLSTTYWENSGEDQNGQMTNEEKYSESADYSCEFFELSSEFGYDDDYWAEYCDNYSSLRDSGELGSVLLWLGTATGAWFLVVAYRSIGGDRRNLSSAFLDPRFCLAAGGSTTLAAVIWRIMSNDAINFFETKVGTGFYITLVGGLLGIGSYLMISRLQDGENEYPVNDMSEDLHDEDADLSVTDAELLRAAEAAVKAKVEAEANPDDPLSWLRMAEAMDAANRHEEAERCRKTAMDLMEKDTL